jgi:hypothetical protein
MSAVSTRNIKHISNPTSCISAEGKFKKVELTFCGFSGSSLSLSQKVSVIGQMSVAGTGSLQNSLPCIFQAAHDTRSGSAQDLKFLVLFGLFIKDA